MLAGRMLARSCSERSYSISIATSARAVSRNANHTAANAMSADALIDRMNPTVMLQAGCRPVSAGAVSFRPIPITTPTAARMPARTMRSLPRTRTTITAATG